MERAAAERVVLTKGWLSQQAPAVRAALLREARLLHVGTGEFAYRIEDAGGGIYGVVQGGFAIHIAGISSGPHLAHIIRSGVWFGHAPVTTGARRQTSAQAVQPTTTFYVPQGPLRDLADANAAIARSLGSLSHEAFRIATAVASDLLIRRADRRIASTLLRVTAVESGEAPEDPAGFRLTQSELGQMANTSRHVVNRTLGRFEAAGWVTCSYNRIAIRRPEQLAAFVREGD